MATRPCTGPLAPLYQVQQNECVENSDPDQLYGLFFIGSTTIKQVRIDVLFPAVTKRFFAHQVTK